MDYSRQTEIFRPEEFKENVHVIGCGATGSWVAMLLGKLGVPRLHLWDFDTIEEHNVPNQLFPMGAVGKSKVEAMKEVLEQFAPTTDVIIHNEAVSGDTRLNGVVFVLTDTMASRKDIFNRAIKNNVSVPVMIETRMDMACGRIYCINPCNRSEIKGYSDTLYTDAESTVSLCGISQSIAPTAALIASEAVWAMLQWYRDDYEPISEKIIDCGFNNILTREF